MPWLRETILARLFVVLEAIPGVQECVRNRGELPSEKRPAIQLLDEDELPNRELYGAGRPSNTPNLVRMSPGIYVTMKNVKPHNPLIGPELNAFAALIIKAVATDPTLIELVGSNGAIEYSGLITDLGEDRTLTGKARVGIEFVYVLRPDEL